MKENNKTICRISVLMPVYDTNEKNIQDAIESVLNQSFADFELIILSATCSKKIQSAVRSFNDNRIHPVNELHNCTGLLAEGLKMASGKYVAFMSADAIMHVDRLKIQYSVLESEHSLMVCGSWIRLAGSELSPDISSYGGWIKYPLLSLLEGKYMFLPTVLMHKNYLIETGIKFNNFSYISDLEFCLAIGKQKGMIYMENQYLLYWLKGAPIGKKSEEDKKSEERIIGKAMDYLIEINKTAWPELEMMYVALKKMYHKGLLTSKDVEGLFYDIFKKNEHQLTLA